MIEWGIKRVVQWAAIAVLSGMVPSCDSVLYFHSTTEQLKPFLNQCLLPHSCLLEYNKGLVGGDPCCFELGGFNNCEVSKQCNADTGENCCLIYATGNTALGQKCCLHSSGEIGTDIESAEGCGVLLGNTETDPASAEFCEQVARTDPPVAPTAEASDCLLSYNEALVSEGEDPCCFRNGGVNYCHLPTECNELADIGCCVIYATESTVGGSGCCLYEYGESESTELGQDRTEECAALLYARPETEIFDIINDECSSTVESIWAIQHACVLNAEMSPIEIFQDELATIPENGNIVVAYLFAPDWIPQETQFETTDPQAGIRVYAAPSFFGEDDLPELNENNRLTVHVELLSEGWLWISTVQAPVGFTQMVVVIDFRQIYINHGGGTTGFVSRFYVD